MYTNVSWYIWYINAKYLKLIFYVMKTTWHTKLSGHLANKLYNKKLGYENNMIHKTICEIRQQAILTAL